MRNTLLLLFLTTCYSFSQAQPFAEKIDSYMTANTRLGKFNGTILVAKDGLVVLEKGYGYKNAAAGQLNDSHTIFQIGSITKQFTSAAMLALAEKKKLSLQDKLSKYFPELPFSDSVTIENLLSHTSGIYNYTNDGEFMKNETGKPVSRERIFSLIRNKPLEFPPGTKFNYSNSGYILAGYIIEKVTGQPYEKLIRSTIFTPLQMQQSGFDFVSLQSPDKAIGYESLTGAEGKPAPIVDSTAAYAAGAIYTTVGDLYKWDRSLYTNKIISTTSLANAYTIRRGKYGLGWSVDTAFGQPLYAHSGGIFGFSSFIVRIPAENTCIILFDNKGDGGLEQMGMTIDRILHNQPFDLPREKTIVQVDSSILSTYVGEYELAPNFIIAITLQSGHLMLQATGQQKFELFAEKENLFFLKVVEAGVEFIKGSNGPIEKLILHQGGQHMPAKKIK